MSQILIDHIRNFTSINDKEAEEISSYFISISIKKKELLIDEGQFCRYNYFVKKGCLRLYFRDTDGTEQTVQFALENWWMTDIDAFNKLKKSTYSIQALEASSILAIDKNATDKLLVAHPAMEKYFRCIYERAYAASLFRIKYIFRLSKEDFYSMFNSRYPEFVQRVPQKILASFLGFTPEYLSELRKKQAKQLLKKKVL